MDNKTSIERELFTEDEQREISHKRDSLFPAMQHDCLMLTREEAKMLWSLAYGECSDVLPVMVKIRKFIAE